MVLLGIDLGTSSAKSVVLSPEGTLLGVASHEYPMLTPHPGWAEQEPATWMAAVFQSAREALSRAGVEPRAVAGIGLSGQMHGTVCVGGDGRPLRPAIIWADQRSAQEVDEVMARIGRARLAAWTGNPLATGFMLATWLWLRHHEPEVIRATRWLMLPKDYVRYRMTGQVGTEPSDASATSLFDPVAGTWSTKLLSALKLDDEVLPPVHPSAAVSGGLCREASRALGIPSGTPVVYGGSDQALQALGNGIVTPGTLLSTIGTGGQLFVPTTQPVVDAPRLRFHSFCHVLPGLWHVETAMLTAGLSLRWMRDRLLEGESYRALADAAATVAPGAEGVLFMPYLAGERTPHMDPQARGAFIGLTRRHTRAHLIRAVMEGVVFGMRQGLDLLVTQGAPVTRVVASGGAVQHSLWVHLQADIYNRPIWRTRTVEAAATGAAMLAGIGTGVFAGAEDAVARVVRWDAEMVEPSPCRVRLYEAHFEVFSGLYKTLAPLMHALTGAEW